MKNLNLTPVADESIESYITHLGEPVKSSSNQTRDWFQHLGSMEDNVYPVTTIDFDSMIDDDIMTGAMLRDLIAGG